MILDFICGKFLCRIITNNGLINFIVEKRYTIDAVTIHGIVGSENLHQLFGFYRIGRLVESTFRSLNNLLEHFHQSFFFYLLPQPHRYVSISQYMPPAIVFACGLILQSLSLYYLGTKPITLQTNEKIPPAYSLKKRHTMFAFSILIVTHLTGVIIFNLMQPSFGWKYLDQFTENEVKTTNEMYKESEVLILLHLGCIIAIYCICSYVRDIKCFHYCVYQKKLDHAIRWYYSQILLLGTMRIGDCYRISSKFHPWYCYCFIGDGTL